MPNLSAQFVSDYRELEKERDKLLLDLERLRTGGREQAPDPQLAVLRQRVEELDKEAETLRRRCAELEKNQARFVREYSELERQRDELRLDIDRLRKEGREPTPDPQLAVLRRRVEELDKEAETLRRRCAELEKNGAGPSPSHLQRELDLTLIRLQETASALDKAKDENFRLRKQLMDCQKRLYNM